MVQTIEDAQEGAPTICQAIAPVVFHPDAPAFSPSVFTIGVEWPALTTRADTAHADTVLTKTVAPDPAIPGDVGEHWIRVGSVGARR